MSLDILPDKNEEYGTKDYWDRRYEQEQDGASFDWFKTYVDIAPMIKDLIRHEHRILMLGCGNSKLSEEMWDDEYKNIVNVDYSPVLIERMKRQHELQRPEMEWHVMDVRHLEFPDASFDIAIDKGTMDAMMTSKGDVWDPPEQVVSDCNAEVDEVLRVLRPGGVFLYLTFGQPHFRRRYLNRPGTTLEIRQIGDAFHYYLYIVRKA